MSDALKNLRRFWKSLWFPGGWWLRDYEVQAIVGFYLYLSPADRKRLLAQFQLVDIIQRSPKGRLVQFFDLLDPVRRSWELKVLIPTKLPSTQYRLNLKNEGKIFGKYVVSLCYGGLAEIQFIKWPKKYVKKALKVKEVRTLLAEKNVALPEGMTFEFEKLLSGEEEEALEKILYRDP